MSDGIFGQRAMFRGKPAWHDLGNVFDAALKISASEAAKQVAGDQVVVARPLQYVLDGKTYTSSDNFVVVQLPMKNSPEPIEFGTVGKHWKPESYVDLSRGLDKLSEKYAVETAGLLKQGSLMFMSFKAEDWDVKGDPIQSYFTANLSLKPGHGHRFNHSPVRVVCWNTNVMAESMATISLSIPHNADAKQQIGIAATMVARFHESQQKTKELCEQFAKATITLAQAQEIFDAAFPDPKLPKKIEMIRRAMGSDEAAQNFRRALDPDALATLVSAEESFERAMERKADLRDACVASYKGFKPTELGGTIWAAYNAVTEVADWREGGKGVDESTMFGSRAKEKSRAFAQSLKVLEEVAV